MKPIYNFPGVDINNFKDVVDVSYKFSHPDEGEFLISKNINSFMLIIYYRQIINSILSDLLYVYFNNYGVPSCVNINIAKISNTQRNIDITVKLNYNNLGDSIDSQSDNGDKIFIINMMSVNKPKQMCLTIQDKHSNISSYVVKHGDKYNLHESIDVNRLSLQHNVRDKFDTIIKNIMSFISIQGNIIDNNKTFISRVKSYNDVTFFIENNDKPKSKFLELITEKLYVAPLMDNIESDIMNITVNDVNVTETNVLNGCLNSCSDMNLIARGNLINVRRGIKKEMAMSI